MNSVVNEVYAIAATNKKTGRRLLIKVSSLATREQLTMEVRRMNSGKKDFIYTLSTEGSKI